MKISHYKCIINFKNTVNFFTSHKLIQRLSVVSNKERGCNLVSNDQKGYKNVLLWLNCDNSNNYPIRQHLYRNNVNLSLIKGNRFKSHE